MTHFYTPKSYKDYNLYFSSLCLLNGSKITSAHNDFSTRLAFLAERAKKQPLLQGQSTELEGFYAQVSGKLNKSIAECLIARVRTTIVSPLIHSHVNRAVKGIGRLTIRGYYSVMDSAYGSKTLREHLVTWKNTVWRGAKPISKEEALKYHSNKPVENANGQSVQKLCNQYGENSKFYQDKKGRIFFQRPNFQTYVKMIAQGQPAGRLELQLLADAKASKITVVDHNDLNKVKETILPDNNSKQTGLQEFRVAFIPHPTGQNGIGHYVPCVKVNRQWQIADRMSEATIKNSCLYQTITFLEKYHDHFSNTANHKHALSKAQKSLKSSADEVKQSLRNLAKTFQNDFKYRRLLRRKFQEHTPELGGAYTSVKAKANKEYQIPKAKLTLVNQPLVHGIAYASHKSDLNKNYFANCFDFRLKKITAAAHTGTHTNDRVRKHVRDKNTKAPRLIQHTLTYFNAQKGVLKTKTIIVRNVLSPRTNPDAGHITAQQNGGSGDNHRYIIPQNHSLNRYPKKGAIFTLLHNKAKKHELNSWRLFEDYTNKKIAKYGKVDLEAKCFYRK